jgi:hypothetical protein
MDSSVEVKVGAGASPKGRKLSLKALPVRNLGVPSVLVNGKGLPQLGCPASIGSCHFCCTTSP